MHINMARRCKECPDWKIERAEKAEIKRSLDNGMKRFSFPRLWRTVIAKDLEEANEKIKAIADEEETKDIKEVEIETK